MKVSLSKVLADGHQKIHGRDLKQPKFRKSLADWQVIVLITESNIPFF